MKPLRSLITALWVGSLALVAARAAEPAETAPTLQQFSDASQALYHKVSRALVRVHVDQTSAAVLPPALKAEFNDWLRTNAQGGRGGGRGDGMGGRRGGGATQRARDNLPGNTTQPTRGDRGGSFGGRISGFGRGASDPVARFLLEKANTADPAQAAELRGLALRVEINRAGFSGDLTGLVLDRDGYTLLLTGLLREAHQDPLKVVAPDGAETDGQFIGTNLAGGYSIIQINKGKLGGAVPLAPASRSLQPGELLMAVTASQGAVSWLVAAPRIGQSVIGDRFPVEVDDRTAVYLVSIDGALAAIARDHVASSAAPLQRDIDYIIKNRRDIEPRSVGVAYDPIPPDSPLRASLPALASRFAVQVREVVPGSPADKAHLLPGDILLNIDGRSLRDLTLYDLATRTGNVPAGIIRNGKELTLQIPLD